MRENIEARNDIAEAEAKLSNQRKNLIDSLANRKQTLQKLDENTGIILFKLKIYLHK